MIVGEQPGDEEDLQGRPFVGPAGVAPRGVAESGLIIETVFLTNAVKHFGWERAASGASTRRRPRDISRRASVWLDAEIARASPAVIVALGATALAAIYGARISITEARTRKLESPQGAPIVATYHPSAVLRVPDPGCAQRNSARRCWLTSSGPRVSPDRRGCDMRLSRHIGVFCLGAIAVWVAILQPARAEGRDVIITNDAPGVRAEGAFERTDAYPSRSPAVLRGVGGGAHRVTVALEPGERGYYRVFVWWPKSRP